VPPAAPDPPRNPGSGRWPSPNVSGSAEDRAGWGKLCNLQRRILPQAAPVVPGYQLVFAYRPAFVVTGDYHDFFRRPDGNTAAFVGDGSGHGPAASMLMAIMRTLLHTHDVHREPGETLNRVGGMFHRLIPSDLFMTAVYLVLAAGGRVSWAAAGHHPPLWVNRHGRLAKIDLAPVGSVLGFDPETYSTVTWQLEVGDRLLLFTDGLWDARSRAGEPFGRQRLTAHFSGSIDNPLADVVHGLLTRVTAHLQGAEFEDDFTILGIERTA
jgi:sigma-B regulation protein RsbU (phosphoserine phosphatase)